MNVYVFYEKRSFYTKSQMPIFDTFVLKVNLSKKSFCSMPEQVCNVNNNTKHV